LLVGPTAITFIDGDAVNVAKALRDFSRTNPSLVIKGGLLGPSLLSAADATALADIPPRDVLLARLAGMFAAPMQQFAGLLQALPRNLAYGLKALVDQGGGAPEAAAEAPSVAVAETAAAAAPVVEAPAASAADALAEPEPEPVPTDAPSAESDESQPSTDQGAP
jgi:large subunit ribosomal protein L10